MSESAPLILIAEDSADLREAYVDWFTFKGFRVESSGDGEETLATARASLPSCIVMDISLPKVSGLEVARRLRADPATAAVALIALTGHGDDAILEDTRAAGFDCYLLKPCLPDKLLAEVNRLISKPRG